MTRRNAKGYLPLSQHDAKTADEFVRVVDFGNFIRKNPHPQYNRYLDPECFQTFSIENGNVVWGKDWDMVFPVEDLYNGYLD